jgi:hypothetical protein
MLNNEDAQLERKAADQVDQFFKVLRGELRKQYWDETQLEIDYARTLQVLWYYYFADERVTPSELAEKFKVDEGLVSNYIRSVNEGFLYFIHMHSAESNVAYRFDMILRERTRRMVFGDDVS